MRLSTFSTSFRKAITRQKMASLLGSNAPSQSYVDQIQVARRGETTPINSPYYISRDNVMTHPQDNEMLVAAQKKFQQLAGSDTNEYGLVGYRPQKFAEGDKRNNYEEAKKIKTTRLRLGKLLEGNETSVDLTGSQVYPDLATGRYMDKELHKFSRDTFYKPVLDIHSHPRKIPNPSPADMGIAYQRQKMAKDNNYENLIFMPENPRGSVNAPYSLTSYKNKDFIDYSYKTPESLTEDGDVYWKVRRNLGGKDKPKSTFSSKFYCASTDFCR